MNGKLVDGLRQVPLVLVVLAGFTMPVPGQVVASDSHAAENLVTSISGPLQRSLSEEYPGSFKTGIDIFWEPNEGWVSPETLEWWMRRIEPEDRRGIEPRSADFMFKLLPARFPVFPTTRTRSICAVVGASGNLIGSHYGEFIDAHDIVIRINRAPTKGFESDVGVKTTHHVIWPRKLDEGEFDTQAFLLLTPVASNNSEVFAEILDLVEGRFEWNVERVRIIHPDFVRHAHVDWIGEQGNYPSTGFVALMIAMHICEEVNVFGFGADEQGAWDRYYDAAPVDASAFHAVGSETRLRREMEAKGLLKVFQGNRVEPDFDVAETGRD